MICLKCESQYILTHHRGGGLCEECGYKWGAHNTWKEEWRTP